LASRNRSDVSRLQAQTALSRVLLDRVRNDNHPSFTQMNLLEQMLPRSLYREYLSILLEKVMRDQWPSTTMLRRIQRFSAQL
jgi:hypothetical protein